MAKRSYSFSGSSNGNNNADHLRLRATHGNGSASSSDGEDDRDCMPPRKLLKSNGLQLRLERFQQQLPRPEPSEEYCPLYTLVDDGGACRSFGFCFRTMKWVGLSHVPESTSRRSVMLPVASAGGLLFYTEDGHSSEDVLVVNPLTGEQKILGVPTFDNGAPAALEEAQPDGDDHENGDDSSEADAEDESVVISDESELD